MQALEFVTIVVGNDSYDVRRNWKYSLIMNLELSKRRLTASTLTSGPSYVARRRVRGSATKKQCNDEQTIHTFQPFCNYICFHTHNFYEGKRSSFDTTRIT